MFITHPMSQTELLSAAQLRSKVAMIALFTEQYARAHEPPLQQSGAGSESPGHKIQQAASRLSRLERPSSSRQLARAVEPKLTKSGSNDETREAVRQAARDARREATNVGAIPRISFQLGHSSGNERSYQVRIGQAEQKQMIG